MAVIESKGNGFSLYNGVKLPSLPEYDKEKYPYAFICEQVNMKFFHVIDAPMNYTGSVLQPSELCTRCLWRLINDSTWQLVQQGQTVPSSTSFGTVCYWANVDIINTTDNSVYLSASEPISLDGMNVIEWDGDREGLLTSGNTYLVSSNTDLDLNASFVVFRRVNSTGSLQPVSVNVSADRGGYQSLGTTVGSYVKEVTERYPAVGIWLLYSSAAHVAVFAYYPIETGDDEDETEIPSPVFFITNFGGQKYKMMLGGSQVRVSEKSIKIKRRGLKTSDGYILTTLDGLVLIPKEEK